jgi:NAD(P)-dependent dehydrogenase (short-subunit alcohol dehydrogenase family)
MTGQASRVGHNSVSPLVSIRIYRHFAPPRAHGCSEADNDFMTLITTRYNMRTTADEVAAGINLAGKRAVVTGGASGIGVETARSLARAGAEVTLAVRDTAAGDRVAADTTATTGNPTVRAAHLDLTDHASISAFTAGWVGPLHVLIANAGVMACPLRRTTQGWEWQFATNHLGHFALAQGLHGALAAANGARVVSLSSSGHLASPVVFDDIHFTEREYEPWSAYGQSKTANVLFAVEATRRWADDGIIANAVMPGGIMTNLQRHVSQEVKDDWAEAERAGRFTLKTPQQGAATTLVAAVAPEFDGTGGHYLEDCNEAETVANNAQVSRGVRRWALNSDAATQLWEISLASVRAGTAG